MRPAPTIDEPTNGGAPLRL